ncbi:hypothetical protein OESDEN_18521 [Oesophagostomum dentatum]|uniref:DNA methyltransferase 1-associated 1 domain-containing protein n=1 Tax=Oesophagostomum dentatum TaxID=61180 RepID=A0A0B1SD16_OESDE|nr:hypothetical protein OESDEN_18521 [Oesophagostomum dentatum]
MRISTVTEGGLDPEEVTGEEGAPNMNPMGTEAIVAAYNEFRSQIILLQELKSTLQTAEFELETLRNRLVEEGKEPFEIEPRMRISTVTEGGLDPEEVTGEEGAPSPKEKAGLRLRFTGGKYEVKKDVITLKTVKM